MKPCNWCAGNAWEPSDDDGFTPVACRVCKGAGRVPGLDPVLARDLARLAGRSLGLLLRGVFAGALAFGLGCPLSAAGILAVLAVLVSLR